MMKELDVRLRPIEAASEESIRKALAPQIGVDADKIAAVRVVRRSIDARSRTVWVNLRVRVYLGEEPHEELFPRIDYKEVADQRPVIIVGAGPAGLFAALRLIESGVKPIVIERGKNVTDRRRDVANISRSHQVDPESNYSFGEGGAGAFSDGKLYTRSKKRGSIDRILQILCQHGASTSILVDAHPHVGTDKLPRVISTIRETILRCGGEVHFQTRVDRVIVEKGSAVGVECSDGRGFQGEVILATGHSARDLYRSLHSSGILLQTKGIAMGVRLEHPQQLIDSIQYHSPEGRGAYLPAAEYSFVKQSAGRGVYSFCMCPGGVVVPAASGPNQVVVNGMSSSSRGGRWANSGMVVEMRPEDLGTKGQSVLGMIEYQEELEYQAYVEGGKTQVAPAQRMVDFVSGKYSQSLPATSYAPGVISSELHQWMPKLIRTRLQDGFQQMGKSQQGFMTNEALMIGVETRTSSPVRIPRDQERLEHIEVESLYPCGEGAGYAGGIVSAAIDGERCAEALLQKRGAV